MANQIAKKPKFSVAIQTDTYKNLINQTLGDPNRASRFIASISSAVAVNPALQECDAGTILSGALLGESLGLSPSPQLGQYFLVPFECTIKDKNGNTVWQLDEKGDHILGKNGKWLAAKEKKAQFVLGYKGYIQLALKSGFYRHLNVLEIKAGELIKWDPLNERIDVRLFIDDIEREALETIGYYVSFEYLNGFKKAMYWSKDKMEAHANKYSSGYRARTGFTYWEQDFDGMAKKTMLRQLISKWGVMSTELQLAYERDMGVIHEDKSVEYIDNIDIGKPIHQDDPVEQPEPIIHLPQEGGIIDTSSKQVSLSDL